MGTTFASKHSALSRSPQKRETIFSEPGRVAPVRAKARDGPSVRHGPALNSLSTQHLHPSRFRPWDILMAQQGGAIAIEERLGKACRRTKQTTIARQSLKRVGIIQYCRLALMSAKRFQFRVNRCINRDADIVPQRSP